METFPTIIIVTGNVVRFAGPVTPQASTLNRLLRATALGVSAAMLAPLTRAEEAIAPAQIADFPEK